MESTNTISQELFTTNNLWILIAAALVFIMHLGFACVESGFVQKKNVINILFKNTMIPAIGLLTYALVGFNLMYPGGDFAGGFFGFSGFGISTDEAGITSSYNPGYTYWSDFIFQGMFAATCATIVSGAVAERIKLVPFFIFTTIFVTLIYPIIGMWHWGGGWLKEQGFHDFAGSSLVHSVGGWGALAGAILLGPRMGKYTEKGIKPIPGHSIPLAAVGVFLLWFGWYGFNGGSVLSADPGAVSLVFVTTSMGAASGAVVAFFVSYFMFKSYDVSMVLNGILGGLVGITAGADVITPMESIITGGIAGALIPLSVVFFDKIKVDDPVGATTVHLVCGIWGTIAAGIFGEGKSIVAQLTGILAIGVFAFSAAFIIFYVLKVTTGIRVSQSHEERGLDISEHEMEAYKMI
jgi:Amt family ammonium transporter